MKGNAKYVGNMNVIFIIILTVILYEYFYLKMKYFNDR